MKIVPISSVRPDPNQPRKVFDEAHIRGLAESLAIEGMINPVEVDEDLMIITGECRWRAAKLAGWEEVPVNVNDKPLPEYERFRRQMAENLHQSAAGGSSPMNAIDVAKGYAKMVKLRTGKDYTPGGLSRLETYGLMKGIPEELGVSHTTVYEYLSLLDQPEHVLESIKKGIPRTYYRKIDTAPERFREPLREAVAKGEITSRDDLVRVVNLARRKPEVAEIELIRVKGKQNASANKILNRAVELGLALKEAAPAEFTPQDKTMIRNQLNSVTGSIRRFLGKLNETR